MLKKKMLKKSMYLKYFCIFAAEIIVDIKTMISNFKILTFSDWLSISCDIFCFIFASENQKILSDANVELLKKFMLKNNKNNAEITTSDKVFYRKLFTHESTNALRRECTNSFALSPLHAFVHTKGSLTY